MMPDLGGLRVLEQMKDDPALTGIPVIVVTGKLESVPELVDELGQANVFPKPFGVAELLTRVAEVTGGPPAVTDTP
jgi:CheY-like chemotaxis protein